MKNRRTSLIVGNAAAATPARHLPSSHATYPMDNSDVQYAAQSLVTRAGAHASRRPGVVAALGVWLGIGIISLSMLRHTSVQMQQQLQQTQQQLQLALSARKQLNLWRQRAEAYRNQTEEHWYWRLPHHRMLVLVVLVNYVQRVPLLYSIYNCNEHVHILFLAVVSHGPFNTTDSTQRCNTLLRGRPRASCFALAYRAMQLQHIVHDLLVYAPLKQLGLPTSCAKLGRGALTCDLLFTHADMVVNVRKDGFFFADPAVRWSSWLGAGMRNFFGQSCFSLVSPPNEDGRSSVSKTFDNRTQWALKTAELIKNNKNPGRLSETREACHRMAAAARWDTCCFGWGDMLYLPAGSHQHLFARHSRHLFHMFGLAPNEVAVPTILRNIELVTGGARPYRRVRCSGSCCGSISLEGALDAHVCAHAVHLQDATQSEDELNCAASGQRDGKLPSGPSGTFCGPGDRAINSEQLTWADQC